MGIKYYHVLTMDYNLIFSTPKKSFIICKHRCSKYILNYRDFIHSINLFINYMNEISVVLYFNSISSYFTINRSVFHKPNKLKEKNSHNPKIKSLPQLCYSTSIYLQSYALSRGGGSFAHFGEHIRY